MNHEFVTAKEWQCLSIESRNAINAHWVEYHRLVARTEKAEAALDKIKIILDAPDQFHDSEWPDVTNNIGFRLDEIRTTLKGDE